MDNNKHKMYLVQILADIYSDRELAVNLGFKGGTAAMLSYGLPLKKTGSYLPRL